MNSIDKDLKFLELTPRNPNQPRRKRLTTPKIFKKRKMMMRFSILTLLVEMELILSKLLIKKTRVTLKMMTLTSIIL